MKFKTATGALFGRVTHDAFTQELGVSVAAIRQARLSNKSKAHRDPPKNWERAVKALAENKIKQYHELVGQLDKDLSAGS